MNYWLLTTEYPPFHGGGISTYCYHTVRMLVQAGGIAVTVFVNDESVDDFSIAQTERDVRLVRFNSNRNNLQKSLGYTARLSYAFADVVKKIIEKEGGPDFIESQDYLGIAYYLLQMKHLQYDFIKSIPIVVTLHSPAFVYLEYNRVPTYRFPDFWTCEMEKFAIKAADLLISPTQFIADEIQKYVDISVKKVRVIANPYQLGKTAANDFVPNKIVCYGKLSPQKGSFELLQYFEKLWNNGFLHALHIIGGTDIVYHPEMLTMGQMVEKKYKKYVDQKLLILHGKIRPAEIETALADAHVIIVPSIVDNLPYVVLEAMANRKVVLASKQGGQREIIRHSVDGFLFDHSIEGDFEKQLQNVLALSREDVGWIGANARNTIYVRYNLEAIAQQKMDVLKGQTFNQDKHYPFVHQEKISNDVVAETNGLLSVVIPYFNMGMYIDECLHSIFNSTYRSIEVIIVNDGSTAADSIAALDRIKKNERVTIIEQANAGLANSRNHGAELAKGHFLAFLDADDKVAPDYYDKAIKVLKEKNNVFFVGSWVQYFENSNQLWPTFTPQPPYVLVHNPVNSSGLVYKRQAFLKGGLNDKNVGYGLEDYDSVISLMSKGFNGVILPEPLFNYRVRNGSMFRQITREKLLYSYKYIAEKHLVYYSKFTVAIANLLNANGPGFLFDNPTLETSVNTEVKRDSSLKATMKRIVSKNSTAKKIAIKFKQKFNL